MPLPNQKIADPEVERNFRNIDERFPVKFSELSGIKAGIVTVTWPGSSSLSNSIIVTHGLGTTPTKVIATPCSQTGTGPTAAYAETLGATTFKLRLNTLSDFGAPASSATTPTSWIAIA